MFYKYICRYQFNKYHRIHAEVYNFSDEPINKLIKLLCYSFMVNVTHYTKRQLYCSMACKNMPFLSQISVHCLIKLVL